MNAVMTVTGIVQKPVVGGGTVDEMITVNMALDKIYLVDGYVSIGTIPIKPISITRFEEFKDDKSYMDFLNHAHKGRVSVSKSGATADAVTQYCDTINVLDTKFRNILKSSASETVKSDVILEIYKELNARTRETLALAY